MSVADLLGSPTHDGSENGARGHYDAVCLAAWWDAYKIALPIVMAERHERGEGSGPTAGRAASCADQSVAQFRVAIKEQLGR